MSALAKTALCAMYKYSGILPVQERIERWTGRQFLAVLLLHRVTDDIPPDGLTVSTGYFRAMCQRLRQNFHVVPLADIFRLVELGQAPPPRTLAITFDDC